MFLNQPNNCIIEELFAKHVLSNDFSNSTPINIKLVPLISVVSPVYKAENIVGELLRQIVLALETITADFEIILVEDGSPDQSWKAIEKECQLNKKVVGIKLSRNFGQHHAITAGIDAAKGEWIVVMDCDLQDNPAEIKNLFFETQKGFDIVFAKRVNRKDTFYKQFTSQLFYRFFSYLSGVNQDGTISNFGIYNKKVIQAICSMREPLRAFSPMARYVGFSTSYVNVEHGVRFEGKSSYSWLKLINLALDISVSYSEKPLRLVAVTGIAIFILGFILSVTFLISGLSFLTDKSIAIITLISIWLVGGLTIFVAGIISVYVGKVFDATKKRPLYFIDKTISL
jgi:dolichol-phosphate mannosyltransferase